MDKEQKIGEVEYHLRQGLMLLSELTLPKTDTSAKKKRQRSEFDIQLEKAMQAHRKRKFIKKTPA
jgi:hypothetical protein